MAAKETPIKRENLIVRDKWLEADHIRRWLEHEGVTGAKVVSRHAVQVLPDQYPAAAEALARYRRDWSNPK